MKKEIDFSKGQRNKFAGKQIVIVGDRRFARRPNPSDKVFRFVNTRTRRSVDIRAANKKEARLRFLEDFNLTRMPAGFEIEEVLAAA